MSDIKLFSIKGNIEELPATSVTLERELQILIEQNMPVFFGVTFLKSEFTTTHGGRIDSLGIDENHCPVIFEYKRSSNENVINQGLFYLDWLMDHKADFELLVMKTLNNEYSERLDWSMPRLICVASNFTKYDEYAVKQINRNIDLVRYKKFGSDLIMFELLNSSTATPTIVQPPTGTSGKPGNDKTFAEQLATAEPAIKDLYANLKNYVEALGDDVSENRLKLYSAFKKIRNIICVVINSRGMTIYLRLNPDSVVLEDGFSRDVRTIGHWATGDLEVTIKSAVDFEKAKPLLDRAYNEN